MTCWLSGERSLPFGLLVSGISSIFDDGDRYKTLSYGGRLHFDIKYLYIHNREIMSGFLKCYTTDANPKADDIVTESQTDLDDF